MSQTATATGAPLRAVESAAPITLLCLDFEAVPDPIALAEEYAKGGDFAAARAIAYEPDGNDRVRQIIGETCKPGPRKGDKLVEYLNELEKSWEADVCKTLSVDPLRCAIVSASIYTETVAPNGTIQAGAVVASWGVDPSREGDTEEVVLGRAVSVTRLACVPAAKPLAEMSPEEQYAAERRLLLWVWAVLGDAHTRKALDERRAALVTYNGARFDVRALLMRSVLHDAPFMAPDGEQLAPARQTVHLQTPRYQTRPHLDLMAVLTDWGANNYMSLETAMARLRVPFTKPDGWNGAAVYPAALEGNWAGIESYNLPDAATLHAAAARLIRMGVC